jgi:UDP-N-acetylglucosamine 2-epimerase
MPAIWFWPNPDAGTAEMAESLRHVREQHGELTEHLRFITNIPAEDFVSLLRQAACVVGNSSAGIKECSFLGTPVVNIGGRQQGRLTAEHVLNVGYDATAIREAIAAQLAHGRYAPSSIYYRPDTSDRMLDVLATAELYTQKRFQDRVTAVPEPLNLDR